MKGWRRLVVAGALVATVTAARPARAAVGEDIGWGSLAVLTNVLYMPAKLIYAGLGGFTGGLAYGLTLGDLQTAENIWVTSMGGDYVLTPDKLRGEAPIAFSGTPGGTASEESASHALDEQPLRGS